MSILNSLLDAVRETDERSSFDTCARSAWHGSTSTVATEPNKQLSRSEIGLQLDVRVWVGMRIRSNNWVGVIVQSLGFPNALTNALFLQNKVNTFVEF